MISDYSCLANHIDHLEAERWSGQLRTTHPTNHYVDTTEYPVGFYCCLMCGHRGNKEQVICHVLSVFEELVYRGFARYADDMNSVIVAGNFSMDYEVC